jgi:hypothetical protein
MTLELTVTGLTPGYQRSPKHPNKPKSQINPMESGTPNLRFQRPLPPASLGPSCFPWLLFFFACLSLSLHHQTTTTAHLSLSFPPPTDLTPKQAKAPPAPPGYKLETPSKPQFPFPLLSTRLSRFPCSSMLSRCSC